MAGQRLRMLWPRACVQLAGPLTDRGQYCRCFEITFRCTLQHNTLLATSTRHAAAIADRHHHYHMHTHAMLSSTMTHVQLAPRLQQIVPSRHTVIWRYAACTRRTTLADLCAYIVATTPAHCVDNPHTKPTDSGPGSLARRAILLAPLLLTATAMHASGRPDVACNNE